MLKKRASKLDPWEDVIGILPDAQIAQLAKVTSENVRIYRVKRSIPARFRGEGEPLPDEEGRKEKAAAIVADNPHLTAPRSRGRPKKARPKVEPKATRRAPSARATKAKAPPKVDPVAAPEPEVPARVEPVATPEPASATRAKAPPKRSPAPAKPDLLKTVKGFLVTVESESGDEEFVVAGADIAHASSIAIQRLGELGRPFKVKGIRYLADVLLA